MFCMSSIKKMVKPGSMWLLSFIWYEVLWPERPMETSNTSALTNQVNGQQGSLLVFQELMDDFNVLWQQRQFEVTVQTLLWHLYVIHWGSLTILYWESARKQLQTWFYSAQCTSSLKTQSCHQQVNKLHGADIDLNVSSQNMHAFIISIEFWVKISPVLGSLT